MELNRLVCCGSSLYENPAQHEQNFQTYFPTIWQEGYPVISQNKTATTSPQSGKILVAVLLK